MAEEDQFEAEPFAPLVHHIARVIPPFSAEVFVLEMVAWKLVMVSGQRLVPRELLCSPEDSWKYGKQRHRQQSPQPSLDTMR